MTSHYHIAFEGPIAAGKTTLATMLAKHLAALVVLEDFQDNEFLSDFYEDRDRWALPMQLWFLVARSRQWRSIPAVRSQTVVVDYSHLKDEIFGRVLLRDRDLRFYQQVTAEFRANISPPDLIVYLDASDEVLLERIRLRGRPYEQSIDHAYLNQLRDAYNKELEAACGFNILRYDTSRLDLNSRRSMDELSEMILSAAR